jgi:hypothetical protein
MKASSLLFCLLLILPYVPARAASETPDSSQVWADVLWQVAKGIAITEGMNALYENRKEVWASLKSLERYQAVEVMKGVVMATWDYYTVWKKLLDNVASFTDNIEETKNMIIQAERTGEAILKYYKDFDYKGIRPTNLTGLIPMYKFQMLDWYLNGSLYYGAAAFNRLAFAAVLSEDIIKNPARINRIAACQEAISETYTNIARQNAYLDGATDGLPAQLQDIDKNTVAGSDDGDVHSAGSDDGDVHSAGSDDGDVHSGQKYHATALMASIAYDLSHTRVRTATSGMLNTMQILDLISSEARDWNKEMEFVAGFKNDSWATKNAFEYNPAPVVFNRDLDLTPVPPGNQIIYKTR